MKPGKWRRYTFAGCALILAACGLQPAWAADGTGAVGNGLFDVRALGAAGDGTTMDTAALQRAIDAAAAAGGTVLLPPGRYLSGTLWLRSNVTLRLEKGATLLGSTARADYQKITGMPKDLAGTSANLYQGLLLACEAHDITLCGEGTIDGQGAAWVKKAMADFPALHGHVLPDRYRPVLINFVRCQKVEVCGLTLRSPACWLEDYTECEGVHLHDLTIHSLDYWNNDGIDIVGCRNVRICNCQINAADDGICLKSESRAACENIAVSNCIVRTSASAFKCGTGSCQGFKNITLNNLVVYDNARSGIALEVVDGGTMENVAIANVTMRNVGNAIFIRLGDRSRKSWPKAGIGTLRDVSISNVVATVTGDDSDAGYPLRAPRNRERHNLIPASITGLPGHPLRNIALSNISIRYSGGAQRSRAHVALDALDKVAERRERYPEYDQFGELPAWGFYCRHVHGLTLSHVIVDVAEADFRPALTCDDVHDLSLDGFQPRAAGEEPLLVLNNVHGALIRGCVAPMGTGSFLGLQGGSRDIALEASDLRKARKSVEYDRVTPQSDAIAPKSP
jgi:hypothetical protein